MQIEENEFISMNLLIAEIQNYCEIEIEDFNNSPHSGEDAPIYKGREIMAAAILRIINNPAG
jgi:hypothetical protein